MFLFRQARRPLFASLLCLQLLVFGGCREIYGFLFYSMGEPDPCDTGVNVYRGDTHFIERDFLLEDGTIDYEKWVSITDPALSPCDPLNNPVTEAAAPLVPVTPEPPAPAVPDSGDGVAPRL
ncbi:MAG: hypothetical protein RIF32_15840 [Leptospirales bacterium]|jgi:hypothetical protein